MRTISIPKTASLKSNFASKVVPTETGCLEWVGGLDKNGYGLIYINQKTFRAHRAAWELFNGAIPSGYLVCHTCDNPRCCAPAHMFLGKTKDNMQDALQKGRFVIGSNHVNSKINESIVHEILMQRKTGKTLDELAEIYKIHRMTVYGIVKNRTWKHVKREELN